MSRVGRSPARDRIIRAERGDEVVVFNRTLEKARALGDLGIQIKSSAAEAVRGSERVHIALSDDAAVDAVLASCEGALADTVVIDHSTALPAGTVERARSVVAIRAALRAGATLAPFAIARAPSSNSVIMATARAVAAHSNAFEGFEWD